MLFHGTPTGLATGFVDAIIDFTLPYSSEEEIRDVVDISCGLVVGSSLG